MDAVGWGRKIETAKNRFLFLVGIWWVQRNIRIRKSEVGYGQEAVHRQREGLPRRIS